MSLIAYRKAWHGPHRGLKKCMIILGVAENMQNILVNSKGNWKNELTFW